MDIDTLAQPLLGGILIGLAAGLFMLSLGRIAGISGIVSELLGRWPQRWRQNVAFLVGLPAGLLLWQIIAGHRIAITLPHSPALLIIGGLLVGFGARLGSGCTSGHGVCGLARLSPRSMAAVAVFMAMAMLTATLLGSLTP